MNGGISQQEVQELLRRYNAGTIKLDAERADKLAQLAAQHGMEFDVASKPIRKGLFDFADMASLGMLPNKWRPESIGEKYHGESGIDKFAGGFGSLAGLGTGILGAVKYAPRAAKAIYGGVRGAGGAGGGRAMSYGSDLMSRGAEFAGQSRMGGRVSSALARVKQTEAAKRAESLARTMYNKGDNLVGLGRNPYNIDFSNLNLIP